MPLRVDAFGDAAWRVSLPEVTDPRAVLEAVSTLPGVIDAVVSEHHALLTFDPRSPPDGSRVVAKLEELALRPAAPVRSREHVVTVRYDGPDLAVVSAATGLPPPEIVERHTRARYQVVAVGFLPGFAYLRAPDPPFQLARRGSPRARVPAGSVGVAGPYTGIYPFASPGGWNLLGTAVDFVPFTVERGAALALGDVVRFEACEP